MPTLTELHLKLMDECHLQLQAVLMDDSLTEVIPNYTVRGLGIQEYDLVMGGYLVTHMTADAVYDERGQQYSLLSFIDENLDKVCEILDPLRCKKCNGTGEVSVHDETLEPPYRDEFCTCGKGQKLKAED